MSIWRCPFECGQTYRRSSGRSIRQHVNECYRTQNSSTAALSDSEVSALIGAQQDSGELHTGIRRWTMRNPRRTAAELRDRDRWDCLWACGKSYRSTSSRSIQRHANECAMRADGEDGHVDVRRASARRRRADGKAEHTQRSNNRAGYSSHDEREYSSSSSSSNDDPPSTYAASYPSHSHHDYPMPMEEADELRQQVAVAEVTQVARLLQQHAAATAATARADSHAPAYPSHSYHQHAALVEQTEEQRQHAAVAEATMLLQQPAASATSGGGPEFDSSAPQSMSSSSGGWPRPPLVSTSAGFHKTEPHISAEDVAQAILRGPNHTLSPPPSLSSLQLELAFLDEPLPVTPPPMAHSPGLLASAYSTQPHNQPLSWGAANDERLLQERLVHDQLRALLHTLYQQYHHLHPSHYATHLSAPPCPPNGSSCSGAPRSACTRDSSSLQY